MHHKKIFHYLKNGTISIIGFILSPLSWWNDLLVNIPLAYFFAYAISRLISVIIPVNKSAFMILAVIGYWLTNVLGMIMMEHGIRNAIQAEKKDPNWKRNIIISLIYSLVIAVIIYYGKDELVVSFKILPDWVK